MSSIPSGAEFEFLRSLSVKQLKHYTDSLPRLELEDAVGRLEYWRREQALREPLEAALMRRHLDALHKLYPTTAPSPAEEKPFTPAVLEPIEAEVFWVEKAREQVDFFIEYVTGMAPAYHHKIWLANIFHPTRKYVNIIGPRNSAKTTITTMAMAYIIGQNPLLTNALISVSDSQASARIANLRRILKYNEQYQNVFPDIEIDAEKPDNTDQFSVRLKERVMSYGAWLTKVQREGQPKDPTLRVAGMGGSGVIGARISGYLLIDDLVDGSMLTKDAQDKAHDYFMQTLMPTRTKTARVGIIGTRWMVDDYAQMMMENEEFFTILIPAELELDDGTRLSYWPEEWPLERLDAEHRLIKTKNYRTQYLCDPKATATGLFKEGSLDRPLPDPLPLFAYVFVTTDWAIGVKRRNDYSVFMAVGIDEENNFYILDMVRVKQGPGTSPTTLGNFVDRVAALYHKVDDILIESVLFSVTLKTLLEKERPDLVGTAVAPKGDKDQRASLVSALVENERLYINQDMDDIGVIKHEWVNYGTAKHDDTLDPMGLLIQHLGVNETSSELEVIYLEGAE